MSSVVQCYEIVDSSIVRVHSIPVINYNDMIYPLNQQTYSTTVQESIPIQNEAELQCSSPDERAPQPDPALSKKKRSRTVFTNFQLEELEKEFKQEMYICRLQRAKMSLRLSLPEKQIKLWFQNRRMKIRRANKKNQSTNVEQPSMDQYAQVGIVQSILPSSDDSAMRPDETHFSSTDLSEASNICRRLEAVPSEEIPRNNVCSDLNESTTLDLRNYMDSHSENAASGSQKTPSTSDIIELLDLLSRNSSLSSENGSSSLESIKKDLESSAEAFFNSV